jgi:gamma-glutamyl hydrolase
MELIWLLFPCVKAAQKGDYFPIHGTCMGFQTLSIIGSGDDFALLSRFDAENISLPLDFTSSAFSSRMVCGAGEWGFFIAIFD